MTAKTGLAPIKIGQMPFCLRCQRPVASCGIETPFETIHGWQGSISTHTGEIIVTVQCHGETWKASNWRGRLA